ncbi:MAG TPA: hypothetical protein VG841_02295 [Caulobacterales bacterium]|nr:hypothetical protein [Caulobacterales bacterium]
MQNAAAYHRDTLATPQWLARAYALLAAIAEAAMSPPPAPPIDVEAAARAKRRAHHRRRREIRRLVRAHG